MNILLTGGTGFIGSHTAVELLEHGHEVYLIDNLSNSNIDVLEAIKQITGIKPAFSQIDLRNYEELFGLFDHNKFDAVIHFAGVKAVSESVLNPLKYYDNNVISSFNLLNCMDKHDVYKLIFSSSATVYGNSEKMPLTEDSPLCPTNPYGKTKLIIEEMCRDLCSSNPEWSIALLRYFNPVGAHPSGLMGENPLGIPNNLFPIIAQVAIGVREKLEIFGNDYSTPDGTGIRDYIHVVDLAKGHVNALDYVMKQKGADVFNLGTGKGYSVLEIVNTFIKQNMVDIPYMFEKRRPGDLAVCYSDPTKALNILHWKAKKNLEDMCKDSWNFQQHIYYYQKRASAYYSKEEE
ncbi:MAG TPA: UDP-glucose 4-epimerase GalE [Candidatus Cloacimonadota bacterium]|nr:UDP-glucose 4-epimerase GalE [Candidatus Cloacimonadota bacterium]HQL14406.1 UDP-glucose 4-epimerase GalE [Candidatus Cloacimonadota bacterium]